MKNKEANISGKIPKVWIERLSLEDISSASYWKSLTERERWDLLDEFDLCCGGKTDYSKKEAEKFIGKSFNQLPKHVRERLREGELPEEVRERLYEVIYGSQKKKSNPGNKITDVLDMFLPDMSKFPHPPVPKFLSDAMRKKLKK